MKPVKALIVTLALSAPLAHADLSTLMSKPGLTKAWNDLSVTVKNKWNEWVVYWQGGQPVMVKRMVQPQIPQPSAAPIAAPVSIATVRPNQPVLPVSTPISVARPQIPTAVPSVKPAAVVKPTVHPAVTELREQKLFQRGRGSSLATVRAAQTRIQTASVVKIRQPARLGKSRLAKTKVGVPVADWSRVKSIKQVPALDIGLEALVSREDFAMSDIEVSVGTPGQIKRLPSPTAGLSASEINKLLMIKAGYVKGTTGLQANLKTVGKPIGLEQVAQVNYAIQVPEQAEPKPYAPLSEEKLKMVAALLLFEKGNNCHMVMGLFHQMSQNEKTATESDYYLGSCAASLKMHQVAFDRLSQVIRKEDKDFGALALSTLVKDLPTIYEKDFYQLLKGVKSFKNLITPTSQDEVAYRMAKGAYRSGDYKTSLDYANRVNAGTEYADEARFLSAMNSYNLKEKNVALSKLQDLWNSLEVRSVKDHNIRALTAINLARLQFSQKQYDKALESYMRVPKDHALWVQGLVEQGWTQIALEDYAGAIGNMYSLHSPYFKSVYQPESFAVRTIGYLNICQYGDAYKTLSWLENDYRNFYNRTADYLDDNSQPLTIYTTVKAYLRGKSTETVHGVPHQIWREMARRKDFLNVQTALNDKLDETKRYEGVNEKIKKEKAGIRYYAEQAKKRFDMWKGEIAKLGKDKALAKNRTDLEQKLLHERDLTIAHRFQLTMLEQGRQGFLDFQNKAQGKLDKETIGLTEKAGQSLLRHAKSMRIEMERVLDNNEFLRYEVFSGSGENIRYQVAGGQVGKDPQRLPASIRPTKMLNWNFDGEFWEDEIGSYRSTLQNACPANMSQQAKHLDDEEEN